MSSSKEALRELGAAIRSSRLAAGLTQRALAARAGLSGKYISEIERGTRDVPFSTLHAIVERGLGLALGIGFDGKPAARPPVRAALPRPVDEVVAGILRLGPEKRGKVVALVRDIVALAHG